MTASMAGGTIRGRSAVSLRAARKCPLMVTSDVAKILLQGADPTKRDLDMEAVFNPWTYSLVSPAVTAQLSMGVMALNAAELEDLPLSDVSALAGFVIGGSSCGLFDRAQFMGIGPEGRPGRESFNKLVGGVITILEGQMSSGSSISDRDRLKMVIFDHLTDGNTDADHFASCYTMADLSPEEVEHLGNEEWCNTDRNEKALSAIQAKVNAEPTYEELKNALGAFVDNVISDASSGHGAAILAGLSILSGLGTDAVLDSTAKAKGRGTSAYASGSSRDSATSVSDTSRFANQMSVTTTKAKAIVASLVTGTPGFSKERVSSFLYDVMISECHMGKYTNGGDAWILNSGMHDDNSKVSLVWALRRLGLPARGYALKKDAAKCPFSISGSEIVEPRSFRIRAVPWATTAAENPLSFEGSLRYTKRMTLIGEGLLRASRAGALRVIDDAKLTSLIRGMREYQDSPLSFSELPRLPSPASPVHQHRCGVPLGAYEWQSGRPSCPARSSDGRLGRCGVPGDGPHQLHHVDPGMVGKAGTTSADLARIGHGGREGSLQHGPPQHVVLQAAAGELQLGR